MEIVKIEMREKPREPKVQFERFVNAWKKENDSDAEWKNLNQLRKVYVDFLFESDITNWKQNRFNLLAIDKVYQIESLI